MGIKLTAWGTIKVEGHPFCWGWDRTSAQAQELPFGAWSFLHPELWGWTEAWRQCLWETAWFTRGPARQELLQVLSNISGAREVGRGWRGRDCFIFFILRVRCIFWRFMRIPVWFYCSAGRFLVAQTCCNWGDYNLKKFKNNPKRKRKLSSKSHKVWYAGRNFRTILF